MKNHFKCETDGCEQYAEFYDPMNNRLCSDCIQLEVETGEYTWDECEAIPQMTPGKCHCGEVTDEGEWCMACAEGYRGEDQ